MTRTARQDPVVFTQQVEMVEKIKNSSTVAEVDAFIREAKAGGFFNSYILNEAITRHVALKNVFGGIAFFESFPERDLSDISYSILIAVCKQAACLDVVVDLYYRAHENDKLNIRVLSMMLSVSVSKNDYLLFGHLAATIIALCRAGRFFPDQPFSRKLNIAQNFFAPMTNHILLQHAQRELQAPSRYPDSLFAVMPEEVGKPKTCIGYEFKPGVVNAREQPGVFIPL